jgi:hypothetical protein
MSFCNAQPSGIRKQVKVNILDTKLKSEFYGKALVEITML